MKYQRVIRMSLFLTLVLCAKAAISQTRDLLLPIRQQPQVLTEQRASEVRSSLARINLKLLASLKQTSRASFNLNLFPDAKFKARIVSFEKPYRDSEAWSGLLDSGAGTF